MLTKIAIPTFISSSENFLSILCALMYPLRDVAFLYYIENICYGGIYLNAGFQDLPAYIDLNISEHKGTGHFYRALSSPINRPGSNISKLKQRESRHKDKC